VFFGVNLFSCFGTGVIISKSYTGCIIAEGTFDGEPIASGVEDNCCRLALRRTKEYFTHVLRIVDVLNVNFSVIVAERQ